MAALAVNVLMINVNLKNVLYDSIHKELRLTLLFKTSAGLMSTFLSFSAIKYFPLTYCTAMRNISPFFAMLFSAMCLAEAPSLMQMSMLTVVTALAMATVLPDYSAELEPEQSTTTVDDLSLLGEMSQAQQVFAWSCLILTPIGLASN